MPLIQETLEICYSREPFEARQGGSKSDRNNYWYPQLNASQYSLNDHSGVPLTGRACGSIVERHPTKLMLYELHLSACNIWKDREIPGPSSRMIKGLNTFIKMRELCQNCGNDGHSTRRCCNHSLDALFLATLRWIIRLTRS